MDKPIIILSMHRSGTSLLAEIVHRWGAYGGDQQAMMPSDEENRRGYWEYLPLVQFNEALLASEDAKWFVPPYDMDVFRRKADDLRYRNTARALMNRMSQRGFVWYWKDPRLGILLPFWEELWKNAIYIVPVRHPVDIAFSIKKRNGFPISASLLIWQYYMTSILRHAGGSKKALFLEYDRFMNEPDDQCKKVCAFLDQQYGLNGDATARIGHMTGAVDPSLRHHLSRESFSDYPLATPEQAALYAFLERTTLHPGLAFHPTDFPLYRGWREFLLTLNALVDMCNKATLRSS
jgi:hypothetical protein